MSPGPWRGEGHEDQLRLEADENETVEAAHVRAVRRRRQLDEALENTRRATARWLRDRTTTSSGCGLPGRSGG